MYVHHILFNWKWEYRWDPFSLSGEYGLILAEGPRPYLGSRRCDFSKLNLISKSYLNLIWFSLVAQPWKILAASVCHITSIRKVKSWQWSQFDQLGAFNSEREREICCIFAQNGIGTVWCVDCCHHFNQAYVGQNISSSVLSASPREACPTWMKCSYHKGVKQNILQSWEKLKYLEKFLWRRRSKYFFSRESDQTCQLVEEVPSQSLPDSFSYCKNKIHLVEVCWHAKICIFSVPNSSNGLIFVKRRAKDRHFFSKNTGVRPAKRRAKFKFHPSLAALSCATARSERYWTSQTAH